MTSGPVLKRLHPTAAGPTPESRPILFQHPASGAHKCSHSHARARTHRHRSMPRLHGANASGRWNSRSPLSGWWTSGGCSERKSAVRREYKFVPFLTDVDRLLAVAKDDELTRGGALLKGCTRHEHRWQQGAEHQYIFKGGRWWWWSLIFIDECRSINLIIEIKG